MIIVDILEEHLEETDFLWNQRSNALNDPNFTLGRLGELEERLFQLQGARVVPFLHHSAGH